VKIELVAMFAACALASALAGVSGAANTGTAFFFGQLAFAGTLVWILVRR
jgi:hypothetical protein